MKRILAILMAIVVSITSILSLSGCSKGTIEADASQYLTKGEWFIYFATETDLQCSNSTIELDIDENSEYYEAVKFIVANEIVDSKTACANLDAIVNKDVVAYTCVNYLFPVFRKESSLKFKDSKKITDLAAAAEAVDYGFVEATSKTKFGPDEYMDADACQKAVEATITYLSDYEFSEEESNFDFVYQDNVYDFSDQEVEVVESNISDYDDGTDRKENNIENVNSDKDVSISFLGLKNEDINVINTTTDKGETVTVKISVFDQIKNPDAYKVGNIIKFQSFYPVTQNGKPLTCCFIKITKQPVIDSTGRYYLITGTLPTSEETIKYVKEGQYSTEHATSGKETSDSKRASGVNGISVTDNGIKFSYSQKASTKVDLDNGRSNKTDPTLSGEFSVDCEIKNITLTTTGFDTIFLDAMFGKPKATVKLKYDTDVKVTAGFPKTRLAPYNNGNGKFPSNLQRSRWTTGNGAKDIKICKVKYAFGPLIAEFGVYLQIHMDGTITVSLQKENCTTYTITSQGISCVNSSSKSEAEINVDINLYAGVELRGNLHIAGFFNDPICDLKCGAGFNLNVSGSLYIMNEQGKYTDKTDTNITGEELAAITTTYNKTKFEYCLSLKVDFTIYGTIASDQCIIGKVVKMFNHSYSGCSKSKIFPILEKHFEDGVVKDKCTKESADGKKETTYNGIVASDGIDISEYNMVLVNNSCGFFKITKVPGKAKNIEETAKSLIVGSRNPEVCTAAYYKDENMICVDAHSPGQAEVWVMTPTMKYRMVCAVIVNENMEVSFVPSNEIINDFLFTM